MKGRYGNRTDSRANGRTRPVRQAAVPVESDPAGARQNAATGFHQSMLQETNRRAASLTDAPTYSRGRRSPPGVGETPANATFTYLSSSRIHSLSGAGGKRGGSVSQTKKAAAPGGLPLSQDSICGSRDAGCRPLTDDSVPASGTGTRPERPDSATSSVPRHARRSSRSGPEDRPDPR